MSPLAAVPEDLNDGKKVAEMTSSQIESSLGAGLPAVAIGTHPVMLTVACPDCGAPEGEGCHGARPTRHGRPWRRSMVHIGRKVAFCRQRRITTLAELHDVLAGAV
jgi:hypothetical protein